MSDADPLTVQASSDTIATVPPEGSEAAVAAQRPSTSRSSAVRFFATAFGIVGSVYVYVGYRLIAPAPFSPMGEALAWVLVVGLFALGPVAAGHRRSEERPAWAGAVTKAFYLSSGLLLIAFALMLARDTLWFGTRGLDSLLGLDWFPASALERSAMLHKLNLGLLGVLGAVGVHGYVSAKRTPPVRQVDVPIDGLPDRLNGFRIVQLSDIHLGYVTRGDFVRRVAERANALEPDLVAITGDLVDGSVRRLFDDAAELQALQSRHGTFFVTGNHEYYSGAVAWVEALRRLGISVLVNEHRVLSHDGHQVVVAGVTDHSAGRMVRSHTCDPKGAIAGAPKGDVRLLLAHQPRTAELAQGLGFDLQLSGHTHGGQIFPFSFMVRLQQPLVAGLHRLHDMWVYVSRGTGFWGPPLRVMAPSEITLLTLRRAPAS